MRDLRDTLVMVSSFVSAAPGGFALGEQRPDVFPSARAARRSQCASLYLACRWLIDRLVSLRLVPSLLVDDQNLARAEGTTIPAELPVRVSVRCPVPLSLVVPVQP